jgi:hypothetical protein
MKSANIIPCTSFLIVCRWAQSSFYVFVFLWSVRNNTSQYKNNMYFMIVIVLEEIYFNTWFIAMIKFRLLHSWCFQIKVRFRYTWNMGNPVNARLNRFWCSAVARITNDEWAKKVLTEYKIQERKEAIPNLIPVSVLNFMGNDGLLR